MRRLVVVCVLVAQSLMVVISPASAADRTATGAAAAAANAQAVREFLTGQPHRVRGRVVAGMFGGYSGDLAKPADAFGLHGVDQVTAATGGPGPGLLGCDYASWNDAAPIDTTCDATLIDWWRRGGLVTVSTIMPNPDPALSFDRRLPDLARLADPADPLGQRWRTMLDTIAGGLATLQDAGVPVLFRPMPEMNSITQPGGSDVFWWAGQDPAAFIAVWRAEYDYLTGVRGLRNLLWEYAPVAGTGNRSAYFPGGDEVDVVGLSGYSDNPELINGYDEMLAFGKPFGFTEMGPVREDGRFDFGSMAAALRARFPAAAFFMTWNGPWSPAGNPTAPALFADPLMAGPGQIDLAAPATGGLTGSPAPNQLLYGFEGGTGTQGWTGWHVAGIGSPWVVPEWSASGSQSLKTDVDQAAGDAYLMRSAPTSLAGRRELTAAVAAAAWGSPGLTAKLYVRVGSAMTWYDGGSTPVGVHGTTLRLDLTGIPGLTDVREMGVLFHPAADTTGNSAVYLDDVSTGAPALHYADFESGIGQWHADGAASNPASATDWAADGARSLKAGVDRLAGEGRLYVRPSVPLSPAGHHTLRVTVRAATPGSQAKLYAKAVNSKLSPATSPGSEAWLDGGSFTVGPSGTTLLLNIDLLPNGAAPQLTELGVYLKPPPGTTGPSTVNLDAVDLI